jgi:MFS transporter, PAT family, beta-lactamase induction signal transducer AmpG
MTLPTLSEHRGLRLLTVCALYLAQGIPWGFLAITLTAWLADQGKTPVDIAKIATLGALPWTFKWVWGPIIDASGVSSMGRRRPWILVAQGLMAVTILSMVAIPDLSEQITLVAWMVFLHNIFNSLQDVAVDALAVDLLPEDERGRANGMMYASKYLGGAIGGAGMATVMSFAGLRGALLVQVSMLALIFLLPLFLRERPGDRFLPWGPAPKDPTPIPPRPSVLSLFLDLLRAFSVRSTLVGAAFAATINVGTIILSVVGVVFIIQVIGWSDTEYSQISGGPGLIAGAGGAVFGGFLADKVGLRRMIAVSGLLMAGTWVVFALGESMWQSKAFVIGIILCESAFSGITSAGLFALFMGISWPRVAATQFTAYMALLNVSRIIGANTAAALDPLMSVPTIYLYCAGLTALTLVLLPWIDPVAARRAFRRYAGEGETAPT